MHGNQFDGSHDGVPDFLSYHSEVPQLLLSHFLEFLAHVEERSLVKGQVALGCPLGDHFSEGIHYGLSFGYEICNSEHAPRVEG